MEGLEASLIDAKILTLVHDTLQQPVAAALQQRLGRGSGAVYCAVLLASSVIFQRGKKDRPDALPTQRAFYKAGGGPRRQMAMAGDGFGLERGNTTNLASLERYDTEWET